MRARPVRLMIALAVFLLAEAGLAGCVPAPPANTQCFARTVSSSEQYCAASTTVKVGSIADRFCDSRGVCNTTYRDQIERQCSVWATRPVDREVCDPICNPGFSTLPGLGPEAGCYAGDELARKSAEQAEAGRGKLAEMAKAGLIRTNCYSIRGANQSRLATKPNQITASVSEEYIDYWREGTRAAPAVDLRSWDGLRTALLTGNSSPHACLVTGFGTLPMPQNVQYLLVSSDLGDNQPNTTKTQRYLELVPRAMADKFGEQPFYVPRALPPASLAEACADFLAGKRSSYERGEYFYSHGGEKRDADRADVARYMRGDEDVLYHVRYSHGLWCVGLHPDLWAKVATGLKQDAARSELDDWD
ncbi:hypothetical protein [Aliidongia sp.]|uniref:hypothetical protein n=1 Tax=Aliidongia sp. TaxID=1914230 RepID=UPI002DDCD2A3|nr:hypothetical protein [Aliidongia sp.]